jgi:hypothetical protein
VIDRGELLAVLETAATELPDAIPEVGADGAVTWTRGGVRFAVLRSGGVDLRVGALIGAAAIRTPDTVASAEGSDWVGFAPPDLDDHALDRLGAWFAAAHRRAAG